MLAKCQSTKQEQKYYTSEKGKDQDVNTLLGFPHIKHNNEKKSRKSNSGGKKG